MNNISTEQLLQETGIVIRTFDECFAYEVRKEEIAERRRAVLEEAAYRKRYPNEVPDCSPAGEPWTDPAGGTHIGSDDPALSYE